MKPFDEFLNFGIVKKRSPNKSRAEFLTEESERSVKWIDDVVEKIGINENSKNSIIKDCYDAIMEAIRARMFLDGYSASGNGAHEAEVSYMKILGFNEKDINFADQLRYFRNGIVYYGEDVNEEYAKEVVAFLKRIYPELRKKINEKRADNEK